MILPKGIKIFGDTDFRGDCPGETPEQITAIGLIRKTTIFGDIVIHPKNEGKRTKMQQAADYAKGMTVGASDIVIPCSPAFVCELKRKDHTKSSISNEQVKFLLTAQKLGANACIALGHEAVLEALRYYYGEE